MAENMNSERPISELFIRLAERFGRENGTPIPKRLLEIGNKTDGWYVRLNPTGDPLDGIQPINMHVTCNGWPVGVLTPFDGCLMAGCYGDEPTEVTLLRWASGDMSATVEVAT